eukprot:5700798-Karenia_brevis.AAC.1
MFESYRRPGWTLPPEVLHGFILARVAEGANCTVNHTCFAQARLAPHSPTQNSSQNALAVFSLLLAPQTF